MPYGLILNAQKETACSTATGYATPTALLSRFNKDEITQLADASGLLTAVMLELALNNGDISLYTAEQQTALEIAQKTLCRACADANALIDANLRQAGYAQPLTANSALLDNAACDLARYYLNDQGHLEAEDVVMRRKKDAEKLLGMIANGQLKLGAAETNKTASATPYIESAPQRNFSRRPRNRW